MQCNINLQWDMDRNHVQWSKGAPGTRRQEALGILDDTYAELRAALIANMTKEDAAAEFIVVYVPPSKLSAVMEALKK